MRADDKLTAFAELEGEISHAQASAGAGSRISSEAVQKPY